MIFICRSQTTARSTIFLQMFIICSYHKALRLAKSSASGTWLALQKLLLEYVLTILLDEGYTEISLVRTNKKQLWCEYLHGTVPLPIDTANECFKLNYIKIFNNYIRNGSCSKVYILCSL